MNKYQYHIDGSINLEQVAIDSGLHFATTIDRLQELGVERADAEAFAAFIFNELAETTDAESGDMVSDEQWARLSLA